MHKQYYLLVTIFLLPHEILSMEPHKQTKEQIVLKMIALAVPDFNFKYDQVMALDLNGILKTNSLMDYPRDQRMLVRNEPQQPQFTLDRLLLRELAETKVYAPLIPGLFGKWPHLANHWIGQSMLYHAVRQDLAENASLLLEQGVDPNKPAEDFFSTNQKASTTSTVEVAVASVYSYNPSGPSMQVVPAVIAASLKKHTKLGMMCFNQTVCNYLQLGGIYLDVIKIILQTGLIDPIQEESKDAEQSSVESCVKNFLLERIHDINTGKAQEYRRANITKQYNELLQFFIHWKEKK